MFLRMMQCVDDSGVSTTDALYTCSFVFRSPLNSNQTDRVGKQASEKNPNVTINMSVESADASEALIQFLADRIEELERALHDDEDFCNRDIDATYEAAVRYLQSVEKKFQEKLRNFKRKLDHVRDENFRSSQQNRKLFDEETEVINQLFSSGQHLEAKQKLDEYEKCFQQRLTIITTIPKLYTHELDVDRYLSLGRPIDPPDSPQVPTNNHIAHEAVQVPTESRVHPSDRSKETNSPMVVVSNGPSRFSTRLASSSSNKSLSLSDNDRITPPSAGSTPSHTPLRSIPSTTGGPTPSIRRSSSMTKSVRGESLTIVTVARYQYERNSALWMACNERYVLLFKRHAAHMERWSLNVIVRRNQNFDELDWEHPSIASVGSIDQENLYIFAGNEFILYSLDSFAEIGMWTLPSVSLCSDQGDDIKYSTGTVYHQYIYHLCCTQSLHWKLYLIDLNNMQILCDHDLKAAFPDVTRFIHVCVNDRTVGFLVQLNSSQYAVIFCSSNAQLSMQSRRLVHLSYAEQPLAICSVYIPILQQHVFFVNDPSARIIHLVTADKYLQSYPVTAHSLCYAPETDEVMFTANDGVYALRVKDQESFFSKFH